MSQLLREVGSVPRILSLTFKGMVAKATFAIGRVGVGMGQLFILQKLN